MPPGNALEVLTRRILKPPQNATLRTVIDLGIFPLLEESQNGEGLTAAQLSKSTKADRDLIGIDLAILYSIIWY